MLKQRIDELERQFQLERETVDSLLPLKEYESKVTEFTKSMDELNLEQERLHLVLSEKVSILFLRSTIGKIVNNIFHLSRDFLVYFSRIQKSKGFNRKFKTSAK